jgi:hypothetical protein
VRLTRVKCSTAIYCGAVPQFWQLPAANTVGVPLTTTWIVTAQLMIAPVVVSNRKNVWVLGTFVNFQLSDVGTGRAPVIVTQAPKGVACSPADCPVMFA